MGDFAPKSSEGVIPRQELRVGYQQRRSTQYRKLLVVPVIERRRTTSLLQRGSLPRVIFQLVLAKTKKLSAMSASRVVNYPQTLSLS